MGLAFRLMIFLLLFNIAVGIIGYVGYSMSADKNQYSSDTGFLQSTFGTSVTMPAESSQNFWYRFLDIISLGLFGKIQTVLNNTIFAFPNLLQSLGIIPFGLKVFLSSVLTIIYTIGIIELFSGKDIGLR